MKNESWSIELLLFSKEILPVLRTYELTRDQADRLEKILAERDEQIKKAERTPI